MCISRAELGQFFAATFANKREFKFQKRPGIREILKRNLDSRLLKKTRNAGIFRAGNTAPFFKFWVFFEKSRI